MSWMAKLLGMMLVVSLAACAAPAQKETAETTRLSPDAARVVEKEGKVEASTKENPKDSPVVCERVKKTGSHMTETFCYTVAEHDKSRERSQEEFRKATQRGTPRAEDQ
jgi:hypothetical protein